MYTAVARFAAAAVLLLVPLAADAGISHDLVVVHSDKTTRRFGICDHWESAEASTHSCQGQVGSLHGVENSKDKYGWDDTDAIMVPANFRLFRDRVGPDKEIANACNQGWFYKKVSPPPWRKSYYLRVCPVDGWE